MARSFVSATARILRGASTAAPQLPTRLIVTRADGSRNSRHIQAAEDDMNENRATRGPSWGLLLLIPAAVILAKGAMRRRAMWGSAWAEPGSVGRGYGHRGHFDSGEGTPDRGAAFRLPPRIEWMLDTWHTRAHQTSDTTEPPESTEPATA
jgi:hypothetical protein